MKCEEVRERITAHLMGEDPSIAGHLGECPACAAEAQALRETLGHLDRYHLATAPVPRRRAGSFVLVASLAAAAVTLAILVPALLGGVEVSGTRTYLVGVNGEWRFEEGRNRISGDFRLATLPESEVTLDGGVRLGGSSMVRVGNEGISLEEGRLELLGGEIRVGDRLLSGRGARADITAVPGRLRIEVREGTLRVRSRTEQWRVRGPGELTLTTEEMEVPPVPRRVPMVPLAVVPGTSVELEFGRYLKGEDPERKRLALRMAVVLGLENLLPDIRRVASEDPAPEVRGSALYAVWRLEPDRAFLRRRVEEERNAGVRRSACLFLGSSATQEDVAFLRKAVEDEDLGADALLALAHMARRGVPLPEDLGTQVRSMVLEKGTAGRARHAALRFLQERRLITVDLATALLFDPDEPSGNRRLAAVVLLGRSAPGALERFRRLFEMSDEESRVIAIDLLCHYGSDEDARNVAGLLERGTPREQSRVFHALGLRANRELDPPVPLTPPSDERDEVRRRLLEWVGK